MITGRVVKAAGGIFWVSADGFPEPLRCKARGIFRLRKISPVAGDIFDVTEENGDFVLERIHERKNFVTRPPVANVDGAICVVSAVEPKPNTFVLDKTLAVFEGLSIPAAVVFTKTDKKKAEIAEIYRKIGYPVFLINNCGEDIERETAGLKAYMRGKFCVLAGNSGVGKTALLNNLTGLTLNTAETSRKLNRGRHTTRTTEIYQVEERTYVADTPGFSAIEVSAYGEFDSIAELFPEIRGYSGRCLFKDCRHGKEEGCAVISAVESGKIAPSRYTSFMKLASDRNSDKPSAR
jgi:ribosome biogenesis GTPase